VGFSNTHKNQPKNQKKTKKKKPTILFVFRYFQRPAKQTTYFLFGTYLMDVNPEVWNLESLKNTKTAEFNQNFLKKQKIKN